MIVVFTLLIVLNTPNVLGTGPKMIEVPMPYFEACVAAKEHILIKGGVGVVNSAYCVTKPDDK